MSNETAQYSATVRLNHAIPDLLMVEQRLVEIGMEREAFCISITDANAANIHFWEPDRIEALRFLARLDALQ
jgi:hypothetical protein